MHLFPLLLSDWAAYLITAAFLSLAGIGLAWPIRNKFRHVYFYFLLPVLAFTHPIAENMVLPKFRDARITRAFNADLPKRMDEITTLVRGILSNKKFTFDYRIDDDAAPITVEQIKAQNLGFLCGHWGSQFKDGSVESVEYRYQRSGDELAYLLTNTDCP